MSVVAVTLSDPESGITMVEAVAGDTIDLEITFADAVSTYDFEASGVAITGDVVTIVGDTLTTALEAFDAGDSIRFDVLLDTGEVREITIGIASGDAAHTVSFPQPPLRAPAANAVDEARWFKETHSWMAQTTKMLQRLIIQGNGVPEGLVGGQIGTLYIRRDGGPGSSLYVKEADNGEKTGWAGL